jgi:hypothetical protein
MKQIASAQLESPGLAKGNFYSHCYSLTISSQTAGFVLHYSNTQTDSLLQVAEYDDGSAVHE